MYQKGELILPEEQTVYDMIYSKKYKDLVLQYVKQNDSFIESTELSNRAKNLLSYHGYKKISDLIFITETEIRNIKGMGQGTAENIQEFIDNYLTRNETRIKAFCAGDRIAVKDDETIKTIILDIYNVVGFGGLSFKELKERQELPSQISDEKLKQVIGTLLADGTLEYVDFRCYRNYPQFKVSVENSPASVMDDRTKDCILRKLEGETLESISSSYNMTRERVRQSFCSKEVEGVR